MATRKQQRALHLVGEWLNATQLVPTPIPQPAWYEFQLSPPALAAWRQVDEDRVHDEIVAAADRIGRHVLRRLSEAAVRAAVAEVVPWAPPPVQAVIVAAVMRAVNEEMATMSSAEVVGGCLLLAAGMYLIVAGKAKPTV